MALRRAVVVDRDSMLLSRLAAELGQAGFAVETLASTVGLTPDLVELSAPDLVVLDAELPGMDLKALLVLTRSLKARRPLRVVVTTEQQEPEALKRRVGADEGVARAGLVAHGAQSLGLSVQKAPPLDVRAIIDEVLGGRPVALTQVLDVRIDLFGKSNFYVDAEGKLVGVFVATSVLQPVGQRVEVRVDLNGKARLKLSGEVAWQRSHASFGGRVAAGMGVRLLETAEADRQTMQRFLEIREPITWMG